jgi:predicted ATPase
MRFAATGVGAGGFALLRSPKHRSELSNQGARIAIELPPLDRNSARRLVREALGKRARIPLTRRIVDRSAGNAFFLEELVRTVAGARSTESFPETAEEMATARLEALDPEARRLLQRASVFGEVFWERALVHLLEENPARARVSEWLDLLADHELVTRRRESRFNGEHEWVFRHALLSEAAYVSLDVEERLHSHRLAGDWLASLGECDASLVAEHFERAGAVEEAAAWRHRVEEESPPSLATTRAAEVPAERQTSENRGVRAKSAAF